MQYPPALAVLGKLAEEAGELASACARCIIQGIDGVEPVTGKPNRTWLEDEMADVAAMMVLANELFRLDEDRVEARALEKLEYHRQWRDSL